MSLSSLTTSPASAICPGQQSLFERNEHARQHPPHLRAAFLVCWNDTSPSGEAFYLDGFPLRLSPSGIANLEAEVMKALNAQNDDRVFSVTYLGYEGVQMSPDDLADAGWRVLGAPAIPLPGPTPPDAGPEPAPHVMQPMRSANLGSAPGPV